MHVLDATPIWWRPEPVTNRSSGSQGSVAFAALVTFTAILLLSPQAWFPVLQHFRIAFLAAGIAIVVYLLECSVRRQAVGPLRQEFVITLVLVLWAALTAPLSYWPGGSVDQLIDPFLKVVVFFWLVASLVTSYRRLRLFMWVLVLCSIPSRYRHFRATGPETFSSHRTPLRRGSPASTTADPASQEIPMIWR
jgi:hypothetical protein